MTPLSGRVYPGGLWFRILNRGLAIENRRIIPALFSERIGYVRVLRLGPWAVRWLPKPPPEVA